MYALKKRLRDCLKKMIHFNPNYTRALKLGFQGYQADAICRRLKVKRKSLYSILNRGRQSLQICMDTGRLR